MIGKFANYGEIFFVDGKYSVKERSDLFSLLPEGFSCNSILEIGCADSTNLRYFAKKLNTPLANCEGVDICYSADQNNNDIYFHHSSVEDYLIDCTKKFDLVLLSDVLEHLYNPWKVLAEIRQLMNPLGHLLISVPNLQNLNYLNAVNSGEFFYKATGLFDETHIRFFSAVVLKQYLRDAGFSLVSEGWRPDQSLAIIRNDIQLALRGNKSASIKFGNLTLDISEDSINKYFGQQVLICAAYES